MAQPLPEVVVSAADASTALALIDELVGREGCEASPGEQEEQEEQEGRVWRIATKYYRAAVRLRPAFAAVHTNTNTTSNSTRDVQAHIIHLTEQECQSEEVLKMLDARACGECEGEGVRLVLAEVRAGEESDQLLAAARLRGYEVVALRAPEAPAEDDAQHDSEPWGMPAARASLHAHTWPNLRLRTHPLRPHDGGDSASDSADSSSADQDQEAEVSGSEGEGVGRAEQFADALAALRGAREAAREGARQHQHQQEQEQDEAAWRAHRAGRLRRAEDLVAAFARAMR